MIIVTGATGQLGQRVIAHLLTLLPAEQIGVSVRDPKKATDLIEKGIRVRSGDFSDADSLRHSFEGSERLLLISSNGRAQGGDTLAQHGNAINVAKELGFQRIFYTSQISASPQSHFPPGRDHAATETMLAESGVAWTALRNGFYAHSAQLMNAHGFEAGVLAGPQDGKVAWTTHDDLAAGAAALLAGAEVIDGPTLPLTGSETFDLADLAAFASEILGRPVLRKVLSDQEMLTQASERGTPPKIAEIMMGYYLAARAQEFAQTAPLLERLIGRKPQSMRDFLAGAFAH